MCGFSGFCNYFRTDWEDVIKRMNDNIINRGPNGGGIWREYDHSVVFGHRRLSIQDLSLNGAQPMISANQRYVLVYNGEIYNCDELCKKYNVLKGNLRSTSDTEILLEIVTKNNVKNVLQDCRGMFAFALYDRKNRIIFLARDRMGEKPLHIGWINNCFVFASDLRSIEVFPEFEMKINREALDAYMRLSYIPSPYTIYDGIFKLEPGCIATIKYPFLPENICVETYWSVMMAANKGQNNLFTGSEDEAANELERILKRVVAEQMIADVPVGGFLSAGIDSTTIISLMQAQSNRKIETFTIGVNDSINEAIIAKEISRCLGTSHTELYVTSEDCMRVIPKLKDIYGEPFADPTEIPTYLVSELAKGKVTVSLSGDGGDELFYGYNLYESVVRIWNSISKIPYKIRSVEARILESGILGNEYVTKGYLLEARSPYQLAERDVVGHRIVENLVLNNNRIEDIYLLREMNSSFDIENNLMILDQQLFLPDSHMVKMDRASMAVSLETRAPFLDRDVVEFAWKLPLKYKYSNNIKKKILKKVLYKYVPEGLMNMPKQGFSIPLQKWIKQGKLKEWATDMLDVNAIENEGYLRAETVNKLWNGFVNSDNYYGWRKIWNILMFEEWLRSKKKS